MAGKTQPAEAVEPQIRIGVSGWRYPPWRGVFYPPGLPQRLELRYLSTIFPTVELNGSFYSLQHVQSWHDWYAATPAHFLFSVKGPRFITHMLKLRGCEQALANFFASGVLALADKLGPILWQFPPGWRLNLERFETFLALLPRDTTSALAIARQHDARLEGRSHLAIDCPRPLRHAVEIRHESFLDERFISLLRAHGAALVIAETARKWPMPCDVTSDFMYLRLHGDRTLYTSGYGPVALNRWADRIRAWHAGGEPDQLPAGAVRVASTSPSNPHGRDVYCYFDNTDVKLRAPADARSLMRKLRLPAGRWRGEAASTRTRTSSGNPAQ